MDISHQFLENVVAATKEMAVVVIVNFNYYATKIGLKWELAISVYCWIKDIFFYETKKSGYIGKESRFLVEKKFNFLYLAIESETG